MLHTTQNKNGKYFCDKIYLSPYVVFLNDKGRNRIIVKRSDLGTSVALTYTKENVIDRLFELLRFGVSREQLCVFLKSCGVDEPDKWIDVCLKEGVIE